MKRGERREGMGREKNGRNRVGPEKERNEEIKELNFSRFKDGLLVFCLLIGMEKLY